MDLREAFTDDTSSIDDDEIESNSLLASLGARVSYVKKYVKKAISEAFKSDDFDDNVIRAIGKKTFSGLGVQARFSNANSWFICFGPLFFGLIIQGGWNMIPERQVKTVPLPINFTNKAFKPLIAWDDPAQGANPSWQFTAGATADTTSLQIGLHTQNGEGERGVNWLVAGI